MDLPTSYAAGRISVRRGIHALGRGGGGVRDAREISKEGLPSFWMPYIEVVDIDAAIERAQQAVGKVEVGPSAFDVNTSIALIRDPLGPASRPV